MRAPLWLRRQNGAVICRLQHRDPREPRPRASRLPHLFTAVEEQLELRLQAAKGRVEVLVIVTLRDRRGTNGNLRSALAHPAATRSPKTLWLSEPLCSRSRSSSGASCDAFC
jgi:hypothetical protein